MRFVLSFLLLSVAAHAEVNTQIETNETAKMPEGVTVCEEHFADSEKFNEIHHFCVNNAMCKEKFFETPDQPCECPPGLTGPHCEFLEGREPPCNIDCGDNGQCRNGLSSLASVPEWMANTGATWAHCVCEEGYSGILCQDRADVDEGVQCGEYRCFNGGTCVQTPILGADNLFAYYCDCTSAHDEHKSYGGRFCQSESTSFCTKDADHNGHQFCVNGGTCREAS